MERLSITTSEFFHHIEKTYIHYCSVHHEFIVGKYSRIHYQLLLF